MKVPASRAYEIARLESNGLRQRMEGVTFVGFHSGWCAPDAPGRGVI